MTTNASCSVSPDPVPVNTDFTVSATGLTPDAILNVAFTDVGGTDLISGQADSDGNATVTTHAYWAGAGHVSVRERRKQRYVEVAACELTIV